MMCNCGCILSVHLLLIEFKPPSYKGGAINFERNGLRPKNFRICGTMGIMCWNFLYFKFSILLLIFIKKSNFAWLKVLNRYLIYEITCYAPEGKEILRNWGIPDTMAARCFVILGYIDGDYPASKPRKENRFVIIK